MSWCALETRNVKLSFFTVFCHLLGYHFTMYNICVNVKEETVGTLLQVGRTQCWSGVCIAASWPYLILIHFFVCV